MENKKERKKRIAYIVDEAKIKDNVKESKYTDEEKLILECFANRLNKLLEEKKIDQEVFAEDVGIAESTLSNYRTGKRFPDCNVLAKISKKLNVSTDYLLGLSDLKSSDKYFRIVHSFTGLSDKAIEVLRSEQELDKEARKSNPANSIFREGINTVSYLLENEQKYFLLKQLYNFLWFNSKHKDLIKRKEKIIDDNTGISFTIDMLSNITKIEIDKTLQKLKEDIEGGERDGEYTSKKK